MYKKYIFIGIIFIILIILVWFIPNYNSDNIKTGKLYINEIMASNISTIQDSDMEYSDYIEIYNGYNKEINLSEYYLSDDIYDSKKWKFPNISIKPYEYLLIFASGKDKVIDGEIHTNFKLSSKGESLILTDDFGNIISKIKYEKINSDIAYGYVNREYNYLINPTPGSANDETLYKINNSDYKLRINEYMTHNKSSHCDTYGFYYDWVELYNYSNSDLVLENLYLSDDINNLTKFRIPTVSINKDSYLVIYLSGTNEYKDNQIYTNFKLGDEEEIILSNGKKIIDHISVTKLPDNISYGIYEETWYYFATSTPGYENNTARFKEIGGLNGNT